MSDRINKSGPHMYHDRCDCGSCSEWRAVQEAGQRYHGDVDIEAIEADATLLLENRAPGEPEPVMQIPAGILHDLCYLVGKYTVLAIDRGRRLKELEKPNSTVREIAERITARAKEPPPKDFRTCTDALSRQEVAAVAHHGCCPGCGRPMGFNAGDPMSSRCCYCLAA